MANTTPNLNLSVTPESTNKSFKAWRLEMDNDTNSNMTKIDDAFGNLNTTKFPVAGGTLTGKVTIKTEDTVMPSLTLYSPEKPNEGRAFASILKNANNDTDSGLMIFDYVRGGNAPSTAAQHLRLILKASATAEKDLMTLHFRPETGTAKIYHLYGEHNPPAIANVTGLQDALDGKLDTSPGSITMGPASSPRITMTSVAASSGAGTGKTELLKSASTAVDNGTFLTDYEWGDGTSANNSRVSLWLHSSAPNLKDRIQFGDRRVGDTGLKYYRLYGEHNKPTTADVEGLDTHYAKISSRTMIRSGEDLNTYVTAGCYQSYSTAEARQILNTPEANASTHLNAGIMSFKLDVEHWGGAAYSQTLTTMNAIQYMRYTSNTGSAWGAWIKMTP